MSHKNAVSLCCMFASLLQKNVGWNREDVKNDNESVKEKAVKKRWTVGSASFTSRINELTICQPMYKALQACHFHNLLLTN